MRFSNIREPAKAQFVCIALLLGGLALLLVEVRFEHQAVLGKKWQAWIPIIYCCAMLVVGPLAMSLWQRSGRYLLAIGFALAPILGLVGFWFHSKAHPVLAMSKVFRVVCMTPGKIPMDADGPPVLAPLALAGLGLLGAVLCLTNATFSQKNRDLNRADDAMPNVSE
ncbi:MAG TPA: hypothetical protein EYN91_10675 [Candidatus Melainabacteria bacterium]|nr:hypothetical protein [Candidatus Melainabacteria bacterium]HIN64073.1 hypothetical protein [Candidatus Obscuribacterales bacterium]